MSLHTIQKFTKTRGSKLAISMLAVFCVVGTSFANPLPNSAIDNEVDIDIVQGNPVQGGPSQQNFNELLYETIDPIKENIETNTPYGGVDGIVVFVIDLFKTYVFPIVIILAVLLAIFGFMDIMISDSEEKRNKGVNYFIWGIVGIIIFVSAEFIFNNLYGVVGNLSENKSLNEYAQQIYNNLIYPFIKLGMYIIMGGMFVLLLVKTIQFITSPSDKAPAQAKSIIISAVTGIVVILLAKTMVEAVYGKQADIIKNTGTIFLQTDGLLSVNSQNYQTIFNIINYFLGFAALFVLCIIIYQAYLMLFDSNTDDGIKKMRKNLLYIFGGLLLIGISYLIVNVLIIN
ncbi:MAG: hypothetical protein WC004_00035 [Candidatus Absconditabacterales bacterium]